MGYSEQTENQIRRATEKAKKKKLEEYDLYNASEDEAVVGDYSPTPTYDDLVESSRNPDPYKGPSSILSVEEADAIRNRIGGKAVDKADAEWQASFDEKQERHGAGEQFPDTFDPRRKMPRSDSEMEELKWGNLKRQGKLREHNARFGGVPEHLLAEEAEQGVALDEFKDIAESSDGFSDEKPLAKEMRRMEKKELASSKEDAAEGQLTSLGDEDAWPEGGEPIKPMPPLGNQILSDTMAQELANAEVLDEMPEAEAGLTEEPQGTFEEKEAEFDEGRDEFGAETERQVAEIKAQPPATVHGSLGIPKPRKLDSNIEKLKEQNEIVDRLGSGESRAEIAAADNPVWQQALADKDAREAAKPDIHERDKATAAEMAARFAARTDKYSERTNVVEPPMINKEGKKLGSKYYNPQLSEVKNVIVDGVIVDREVVDREGAREAENAKKKQEGMVWVIPSKGGFKPGDPRFAGQGAGRWMREDQALAAETTNIERPIEEARRQAVKDKKDRTPQEVAEDNIREKRDHEIEMQQIEHGGDDDDDLDEETKTELEIQRVDRILATPGLSSDDKNYWEALRIYLLGGGTVGGAGAPVPPAGTAGVPPAAGGGAPDASAPAADAGRLNLMEPSDVSLDLSNKRPELEGDLNTLIADYIKVSTGETTFFNPKDWWDVGTSLLGAEDNSSNVKNLAYLSRKLAAMVNTGDIDNKTIKAIRTKIIAGMHGEVKKRLGEPVGGSDEAEWILIQEFYGHLMADPPRVPPASSVAEVMAIPIGAWGH